MRDSHSILSFRKRAGGEGMRDENDGAEVSPFPVQVLFVAKRGQRPV